MLLCPAVKRRSVDMARLSPTQAKVVRAKVQAELADIPQAVAAQQVFPHQTPNAASVSMSRELKKANVQEALQEALAKHNLTADRIMGVVDDAMDASKTVILGSGEDAFADVVADHSIRLKAAGMAAQFLGMNKPSEVTPSIHFHNHQAAQKQKYEL